MEKSQYIVASVSEARLSNAILDYAAWFSKKSDQSLKLFHSLRQPKIDKNIDLSGNLSPKAKSEMLNELVEIEHEQNKLLQHKAKLILENYQHRAVE